jgi:hypothetical protein
MFKASKGVFANIGIDGDQAMKRIRPPKCELHGAAHAIASHNGGQQ